MQIAHELVRRFALRSAAGKSRDLSSEAAFLRFMHHDFDLHVLGSTCGRANNALKTIDFKHWSALPLAKARSVRPHPFLASSFPSRYIRAANAAPGTPGGLPRWSGGGKAAFFHKVRQGQTHG